MPLASQKPFNEPAAGQMPMMDGFVADFISMSMVEHGWQPTYQEYAQIMTGYTPVLSGLARGFATFDHRLTRRIVMPKAGA